MNQPPTPDPVEQSPGDARREPDATGEQAEAMRALLVRLLQDVVLAESRLGQLPASTLVEGNQQLVVSAMSSQAQADAARQALQSAAQTAMLDALTGLPNRNALRDRFTRAAAHARRHGSRCALLFVDLDDFKRLNDTHGHLLGDHVLKRVAERLAAAVREVDTVSRHGGDEFLVLLAELAHPQDARPVADKLAAALAEPMEVDGRRFRVTASIGMAVFPDDGEDIDTLVARADAAMYACKRRPRETSAAPAGPPVAVATASPPPHKPVTPDELTRRLAELRDANERLILSALDAQRLAEAAEQARRRQAALLAAVARELRDPMAPIRIATAMLGRPSADEPLLPRVEHIVAQQMKRMSALVDAVGAVGGDGGAGTAPQVLQLQRHRLDLGAIVDAAVADIGPLAHLKSQQISWQRPAQPVDAMGDAAALEQVVVNLLDNALLHTRFGGRVGVQLARSDAGVTLMVTDDGVGITPAMLPIIFEPFVQDVRTLGADGVGLGVGLTVARALARALGGDITAHSGGDEQGSVFVMTLPLADPPSAATRAGGQA